MLGINILIATVAVLGCAGAWYQLRKARKQHQINLLLSDTLEDLFTTAQAEVSRNKKLLEKAQALTGGAAHGFEPGDNLLDDPGMLATLVTAIVNKYGSIILGMSDFTTLGDEDFVSVYVDTRSQDLILSLKPDLTDQDTSPFVRFNNSDDGTFH